MVSTSILWNVPNNNNNNNNNIYIHAQDMTCPQEKLWPSVTQPISQPDQVVLHAFRALGSMNLTIRKYYKYIASFLVHLT